MNPLSSTKSKGKRRQSGKSERNLREAGRKRKKEEKGKIKEEKGKRKEVLKEVKKGKNR